MKEDKNCKIVQDLLPNYIENLTNDETNEFIEQHIERCLKCEQSLKDMKGDLQLKKIEKNKEINVLKKVKRRMKVIILVSILSFSIIFYLCVYFWNNYSIGKNENGELKIISNSTNFKTLNYTHLLIKGSVKNNLEEGFRWIVTINEKNICVNIREISTEYPEDVAKEIYQKKKASNMEVYTNVKLENSRIYQNVNLFNGKSKEEIIDSVKKTFENVSIIEI